MFICRALKQRRRQKCVRGNNKKARSQGDLPPVLLANHPLNDPASLFKSDCAAVRKDLRPITVERRIKTYVGGIVTAFALAKHTSAAIAARQLLRCGVNAIRVKSYALQRIKNGEFPSGCRWWLEEPGSRRRQWVLRASYPIQALRTLVKRFHLLVADWPRLRQ